MARESTGIPCRVHVLSDSRMLKSEKSCMHIHQEGLGSAGVRHQGTRARNRVAIYNWTVLQPRKHHGKVTRYMAVIQEHDIIVQEPSCLHTHALFSTAAKRKNGSRRTCSRRGGLTAPMAAHWKDCATILALSRESGCDTSRE